jgi:hypothetical protein
VNIRLAVATAARSRLTALVAAVALASWASLAGCSLAGTAVKKAVSTVQANKLVIGQFAAKLKVGQQPQFEATYVTTGSAPSTVVYAVRPPGSLLFSAAPSGSGSPLNTARVIMNLSGAYACTRAPGAGWVCDKLAKSSAAAQKKVLDFYTPAHWVAFLTELALTAGFAGDKISRSTMTGNGFTMQCVDLRATGVAGTSKICAIGQHLLGYVQVASVSTSFEIKSYSGSPPAALFDLPAGAKITKAKTGTK